MGFFLLIFAIKRLWFMLEKKRNVFPKILSLISLSQTVYVLQHLQSNKSGQFDV